MSINDDENLRIELHSIYVAIFNANKNYPNGFSDNDKTRLLTALMGGRPWSWKVVGITKKALDVFKDNDFKLPPQSIHRGHKINRIETARQLFNQPSAPLMLDEFFRIFLKNDETVLMTVKQNLSKEYPKDSEIIPIDNPNSKFFPSEKLMGWRHGAEEIDYLRKL